MSKKIYKFIQFIVILTFFVPLIVIPSSFVFPFIVPKIVVLRSLVLLILGAYSLLLLSNFKKYKPRFTKLNTFVALFFISLTLSTMFGVDWYKSFWDNHERMLGLFTLFHYVAYYFILTTLFKDWKEWRFFLRFFLFAGSIVMFIGFLQIYVSPNLLLNRGITDRVSATLGNAIYFSAYGLFLFFVGLLLGLKEKKRSAWQAASFVGAFLGLMGVFWGGTRGTFLGLLAGFVILFLVYVVNLKQAKKIRIALLSLAGLFVILLGIMFAYRHTPFVSNFPAVGRLLNTNIFEGTANTRFMAWEIALKAAMDKPLFGWGPNNYFYAFNFYYNPDFLIHGWGETWFDNAHNILVNTMATQGLFGFIIYISLFGVGIASLYKAFKQDKIDLHTFAIPSAFLFAHLVGNIFVFENPTSYLYFFFFLAFISSISSPIREESPNQQGHISGTSVMVATICVLFVIFTTNINPAKANTASLRAIRSLYNGDRPLEKFEEALKTPSPHIDDIRNDYARVFDDVLPEYAKVGKKDYLDKIMILTLDELNKNLKLHPLDIRIHIQAIQLLRKIGSQESIEQAEKLIEDAILKSPDRQQLHYVASEIKLMLGKKDEAEKIIEDSLNNNRKLNEAWFRLIMLKNYLGKNEEALQYLDEAIKNNIVFTQQQADNLKAIFGDVMTEN